MGADSTAPDTATGDDMQIIIDIACAVSVAVIAYIMLRTSAASRDLRNAADELKRNGEGDAKEL